MDRMIRKEDDSMETSSGKLLYHILTSGYEKFYYWRYDVLRAFLEAFPNDSVEIRKRMAENRIDGEDVSAENNMDSATLFDKEGNLCMPRVYWYMKPLSHNVGSIFRIDDEGPGNLETRPCPTYEGSSRFGIQLQVLNLNMLSYSIESLAQNTPAWKPASTRILTCQSKW